MRRTHSLRQGLYSAHHLQYSPVTYIGVCVVCTQALATSTSSYSYQPWRHRTSQAVHTSFACLAYGATRVGLAWHTPSARTESSLSVSSSSLLGRPLPTSIMRAARYKLLRRPAAQRWPGASSPHHPTFKKLATTPCFFIPRSCRALLSSRGFL